MEKYEAITLFLLEQISDLSQTKWNKLLFFIDGATRSVGNQVTDLKYIKLPYGPVPFDYSGKIQAMYYKGFISIQSPGGFLDSKLFIIKPDKFEEKLDQAKRTITDQNHQKIIDKVFQVFKNWNANQLSDFSHELDAWKIPNMYSDIDLDTLKSDTYLKQKYKEENFGRLLLSQ
ncbi:Panacea domain-containing protein [Leptospira santarosai]|uniref:Panacea domain-containing protein n=1 Tax=Leptospira santarosai TaxID=28183 RepID=UPI0024AFE355|nr:Panacea domain-containing protein [Leptospira santarosai]MDI7206205.1 Panacea domain-containing protein [Leptospira santarosai]